MNDLKFKLSIMRCLENRKKIIQREEEESGVPGLFSRDTRWVELLAMKTVMEYERELGFIPRDVSAEKVGYNVEPVVPETGTLRFIEVKGRGKRGYHRNGNQK